MNSRSTAISFITASKSSVILSMLFRWSRPIPSTHWSWFCSFWYRSWSCPSFRSTSPAHFPLTDSHNPYTMSSPSPLIHHQQSRFRVASFSITAVFRCIWQNKRTSLHVHVPSSPHTCTHADRHMYTTIYSQTWVSGPVVNPLLVTSLRKVHSDKAGTFTSTYSYMDRAPKNIYIYWHFCDYLHWLGSLCWQQPYLTHSHQPAWWAYGSTLDLQRPSPTWFQKGITWSAARSNSQGGKSPVWRKYWMFNCWQPSTSSIWGEPERVPHRQYSWEISYIMVMVRPSPTCRGWLHKVCRASVTARGSQYTTWKVLYCQTVSLLL